MSPHFRTQHVREILKVTPRQVNYWDKTGLVTPSGRGEARERFYSFSDMVKLWFIKTLKNENVSIQMLRVLSEKLMALIEESQSPPQDLTIMVRGDWILVANGELFMTDERDFMVLHTRDLVDLIVAADVTSDAASMF